MGWRRDGSPGPHPQPLSQSRKRDLRYAPRERGVEVL